MSFLKKYTQTLEKVSSAMEEKMEKKQRQLESEMYKRERQIRNAELKASSLQSDKDLVNQFKSSQGYDKVAYAKELESRGYLKRDEDGKFKRTNKTL
ncbi:hypothetical protein GMB50_10510 [Turicibacter sanguinis]|nr:hypothetical protein [Turicibacter sanguinis]MTP47951.1 hypothetical protein [Turicibacter sanguinis]MTP50699.1 hypothetical protein [Turicibacter sanguinis]MTQ07935.1 hypothetical protein [Turicibacter sanguinis]